VAVSVEDGPPAPVPVETALVERIFSPVIENACRYARSQVGVEIDGSAGHWTLVVADDGPGVGPHEAERIFEPGGRGSAGEPHPGAGLGLALARRLARSAGGDVVAGPSDNGARFEIRLPRA
jgi:signal transduction histidine kinase